MRFICIIQHASEDDPAWEESYDIHDIRTLDKARVWAERLVQDFNNTLRPHEQLRKLVDVIAEGVGTEGSAHDWEKTNAITRKDRLGIYDTMRCRKCGITGKRFGLNSHTTIDNKFRAKKYKTCHISGLN